MRILMVGNSLTTSNGLPDILSDLLNAEVTVIARGGARLSEFSNPATKTGAAVADALAAERLAEAVHTCLEADSC